MRLLGYDVPPGHPLYAQLRPCPTCSQDLQQKYLRELCGLVDDMLTWTLSNTARTPANAAAYDAATRLVETPERFLTLSGRPGVGKTRILASIVNEARKRGRTAVYTTTAELLDHLRAAYAPGANVSFDGLLSKVSDCTVLALDEFDRYNATPWAEEKFFQLIENRYRRGDQVLTCFATNAKLADLPHYVTSRMQDRRCAVFEILGPDMRKLV